MGWEAAEPFAAEQARRLRRLANRAAEAAAERCNVFTKVEGKRASSSRPHLTARAIHRDRAAHALVPGSAAHPHAHAHAHTHGTPEEGGRG